MLLATHAIPRNVVPAAFVLVASMFALLMLVVLCTAQGSRTPATGVITGVVLERGSIPVAGAQVSVPALRIGVEADTLGRFRLLVPAGTHDVDARSIQHVPGVRSVTVEPGRTTELRFDLTPRPVHSVGVIEIHGRRKIDTKTSETVHQVDRSIFTDLKLDRVSDAIGLEAGAVLTADGELHVR
ncbi:MAG TPA: carboxypeptidase regulatory-like domain-containing protein, partial [Candidatus Limnocylindria bacterium]|nr:carboxypeptidase regulatory-like domain-containing protein [Candidatus Limnocylindria bacterium]